MENTSIENVTEEFKTNFYFYEIEQITFLRILLLGIILGNSYVLYEVLGKEARKRRFNYFIRHLAIADLLVGLVNVSSSDNVIWGSTSSWNFGNVGCKIIRYIQANVSCNSAYIIVSLIIDRYQVARNPRQCSNTPRKISFLVGSSWLASSFVAIPTIFLYSGKTIQGHYICWVELSEQWEWIIYVTLVAAAQFLLPVLIIIYFYTKIFKVMLSTKFDNYNRQNMVIKAYSNSTVETIKISAVIATFFILCGFPLVTFDLLQVYDHLRTTQSTIALAIFVQLLAPVKSVLNPLVYLMLTKRRSNLLLWVRASGRREESNIDDQPLRIRQSKIEQDISRSI